MVSPEALHLRITHKICVYAKPGPARRIDNLAWPDPFGHLSILSRPGLALPGLRAAWPVHRSAYHCKYYK